MGNHWKHSLRTLAILASFAGAASPTLAQQPESSIAAPHQPAGASPRFSSAQHQPENSSAAPVASDAVRAAVVSDAVATPTRGGKQPCVLLHNDNVLFGSASQLGEYVVVRSGPGNEIRLPRTAVACWADSLESLYQYRVDRRSANDPRKILDDARWCIRYDLFDQAADDIDRVLTLSPGHSYALRVREHLQGIVAARISPPSPVATLSPIQPVAHHESIDSSDADLDDLDPSWLTTFSSDIQPLLINHCGRCHSHTSGRQWRLITPSAAGRTSARMSRENLIAALPLINRSDPESSRLWTMAQQPHGNGYQPDPRQLRSLQSLQSWLVAFARGDTPPDAVRPQPPANVGPPGASGFTPPAGPAHDENAHDVNQVGDIPSGAPPPNLTGEAPARLPEVANPFDPELFNRRYHPAAAGLRNTSAATR